MWGVCISWKHVGLRWHYTRDLDYRNSPKYWDKQSWANSIDPDAASDHPVSIVHKSIAGHYRPVRVVADGPITARCRFIKNAGWAGSTLFVKKAEVVYQPAYGKSYKEPTITVKGQWLQVVDKFTCLGRTFSRVVHIYDEVIARVAKPSAAFRRLRGSIWDRNGKRLDTKLKVYRSVVLSTLLYECETWTVYQRHAKRLNHFHTSCLRKLLNINLQNRIPYTEVLKRVGMQSLHTPLK